MNTSCYEKPGNSSVSLSLIKKLNCDLALKYVHFAVLTIVFVLFAQVLVPMSFGQSGNDCPDKIEIDDSNFQNGKLCLNTLNTDDLTIKLTQNGQAWADKEMTMGFFTLTDETGAAQAGIETYGMTDSDGKYIVHFLVGELKDLSSGTHDLKFKIENAGVISCDEIVLSGVEVVDNCDVTSGNVCPDSISIDDSELKDGKLCLDRLEDGISVNLAKDGQAWANETVEDGIFVISKNESAIADISGINGSTDSSGKLLITEKFDSDEIMLMEEALVNGDNLTLEFIASSECFDEADIAKTEIQLADDCDESVVEDCPDNVIISGLELENNKLCLDRFENELAFKLTKDSQAWANKSLDGGVLTLINSNDADMFAESESITDTDAAGILIGSFKSEDINALEAGTYSLLLHDNNDTCNFGGDEFEIVEKCDDETIVKNCDINGEIKDGSYCLKCKDDSSSYKNTSYLQSSDSQDCQQTASDEMRVILKLDQVADKVVIKARREGESSFSEKLILNNVKDYDNSINLNESGFLPGTYDIFADVDECKDQKIGSINIEEYCPTCCETDTGGTIIIMPGENVTCNDCDGDKDTNDKDGDGTTTGTTTTGTTTTGTTTTGTTITYGSSSDGYCKDANGLFVPCDNDGDDDCGDNSNDNSNDDCGGTSYTKTSTTNTTNTSGNSNTGSSSTTTGTTTTGTTTGTTTTGTTTTGTTTTGTNSGGYCKDSEGNFLPCLDYVSQVVFDYCYSHINSYSYVYYPSYYYYYYQVPSYIYDWSYYYYYPTTYTITDYSGSNCKTCK